MLRQEAHRLEITSRRGSAESEQSRKLVVLVTQGLEGVVISGASILITGVGGVMAAMATLVAATHICIPSIIYNALFNREQTQPA